MCQSAYLHVPFCNEICSYCDFTRCRYHAGLAEKWLVQVCKDIVEQLADTNLDTMYLGGGTPSALSVAQLETLLTTLLPYTNNCTEYTMEANVESLTREKILLCKTKGINRISLGVQSLQPILLDLIHRHHAREDVVQAITMIHDCGIHNISVDLIYGLPQQTMAMWKADLADIVKHFDVQHISLYALSIEEHSTFGRNGVQPMQEDLEADMYDYAIAYLSKHGFEHYEISNFTKGQKRSLHNQAYWRYDDFIGIGSGASGKQGHERYDNTRNLHTYLTKGATPDITKLTKQDEMFEMIMMSLRLKEGVSLTHFQQVFCEDMLVLYQDVLKQRVALGHLIVTEDSVRATETGWHILHDVLLDFLP